MTLYVIIKISGGLGNQLFQIANAYNLSKKYNRKLLICDQNSSDRPTYWNNVLHNFKDNLIHNDVYENIRKKSTIYSWAMTRFEYKEIILSESVQYYCIDGYYQSYKYFNIGDFKNMIKISTKNKKQKSPKENDVCLHIRRTDYMQNNFHKVLSLSYYYNSLKDISRTMEINNIYIFSDDLEWVREKFKWKYINSKNIHYVKLKSDIDELSLMNKFKTIVIANSSFSWWASYVGSENKKIYAPQNWFNNGCHLNTKDLRPTNWNIIDDDAPYESDTFSKDHFNIISLGTACCMVQNIHDNIYKNLGPLFRQPDNATNFFDWLIIDFKTIVSVFENLVFRDDEFLSPEYFTMKNVKATSSKLHGGWASTYRKVEHTKCTMISLHDVKKGNFTIPVEFYDKYKRRFNRLYEKIINHDVIHLVHCFDFQWLDPYLPNEEEIKKVFEYCKQINHLCDVKLYFIVHPDFQNDNYMKSVEKYKNIKNVYVHLLKDIGDGWKDDWKSQHLDFKVFFNNFSG